MVVSNTKSDFSYEKEGEQTCVSKMNRQDTALADMITSLSINTGCGRSERIPSEKIYRSDEVEVRTDSPTPSYDHNRAKLIDEREPAEKVLRKVSFQESRTLSTASMSVNTSYIQYHNSDDSTQSNDAEKALLTYSQPSSRSSEELSYDDGEVDVDINVRETSSTSRGPSHELPFRMSMSRSVFLYNLSKPKQEEGKKRRESIALASFKKRQLPKPEDFGTIPLSRACDVYYRGMRALQAKQLWISEELEQRTKEELAQHEFKLADGAFAYDPDILKRNDDYAWHLVSQPLKRLPLSRAHNMYERSLKLIHAKNEWIAIHSNIEGDCDQVRISKKMPLSRANDMYYKSIRILHARNKRIALHESNIDEKKDNFKLPLERAEAMYEKSVRYIHAKHEWLIQAKKEKEDREEQNKIEYGTMPISKAADMHMKGVRHLQEKKERIAELRSIIECEEDNESYMQRNAKIPISQASNIYKRGLNTMYLKEAKLVQHRKKNQSFNLSALKASRRTKITDNSSVTTMTADTSTVTGGSFDTNQNDADGLDMYEERSESKPKPSKLVTMTPEERSFISRANELYASSLNIIRARYEEESGDQHIEMEVMMGKPTLTFE